jgi:hypothetical protein
MADALAVILETKEAERLATGFVFTEGRSGIPTASTTSWISGAATCTA